MIGAAHPRRNVQPSAGGQRSGPQPTARRSAGCTPPRQRMRHSLGPGRRHSAAPATLACQPEDSAAERALRFALSARFDGTQSCDARRSRAILDACARALRPRAKLSSAAAAAQPSKKTHSRPLRHGRGAGKGRVKTAHAPDVVTLRGAPLSSRAAAEPLRARPPLSHARRAVPRGALCRHALPCAARAGQEGRGRRGAGCSAARTALHHARRRRSLCACVLLRCTSRLWLAGPASVSSARRRCSSSSPLHPPSLSAPRPTPGSLARRLTHRRAYPAPRPQPCAHGACTARQTRSLCVGRVDPSRVAWPSLLSAEAAGASSAPSLCATSELGPSP
jgi:hypothetical protein